MFSVFEIVEGLLELLNEIADTGALHPDELERLEKLEASWQVYYAKDFAPEGE